MSLIFFERMSLIEISNYIYNKNQLINKNKKQIKLYKEMISD